MAYLSLLAPPPHLPLGAPYLLGWFISNFLHFWGKQKEWNVHGAPFMCQDLLGRPITISSRGPRGLAVRRHCSDLYRGGN